VGVSSCLLGRGVRYDGGHKRNRFLLQDLAPFVQWVPVCPEVELGLGTPRPAIRLLRSADESEPGAAPRMIQEGTGEDLTESMQAWAAKRNARDDMAGLHGFVLKKDSPSCGVFRVRVYDPNGSPSPLGRGLWAEEVTRTRPSLPVEEEGRLNDPILRENFILRLFAYARWRRFKDDAPSAAGLVQFHADHKLVLMAHHQATYGDLGRLVADAGKGALASKLETYEELFMQALGHRVSRGRHVNVLQHVAGFLKEHLDGEDKKELEDIMRQYRTGHVPLVVPLTLLRHLLRRHGVEGWLMRQAYLDPYPSELMLRNVV
jgi:uncharacterized protein YbgA (DUF1722 family)/uncharacterized protein YbbK (DUF523 family)